MAHLLPPRAVFLNSRRVTDQRIENEICPGPFEENDFKGKLYDIMSKRIVVDRNL